MPELPEVETIKRGLEKKIVGLKIIEVELITPKSFFGNPNKVEKKKVVGVWRRGKVLGVELEVGPVSPTSNFQINLQSSPSPAALTILIHLKMTGQLVFISSKLKAVSDKRFVGGHPTQDMKDEMPNRSTRVVFKFSDGSRLFFNDQRRFGWVRVISNDKFQISNFKFLDKLGPEPLGKDFTWQILKERVGRRKNMPVKVAIMDQEIVAGIGNIYAVEACFDAKIDPRKKVSELTDQQFKALHQGIIKSLKDGIKHGGSSRAHFVNAEGQKGYFLDYAFVYGREKQSCKVCNSKLVKIKLGGRGTVYCSECQK